jgi:copper chaperone NosL
MKRAMVASLLLLSLLQVSSFGWERDDLVMHPECSHCGMNRKNFAHSRMLVNHGGEAPTGVCSIYCTAKELLINRDQEPDAILVADYSTHELIDAFRAYWVLGGSRTGVMAEEAKWAFQKKEDAMAFIRDHGGRLIAFEEAIAASYLDMYEDMKTLRRMKLEYRHAGKAKPYDG